MVSETVRLNVTPGGVPVVLHVSQHDAGWRQFTFEPYDKGVLMPKISGATVTVEGTKPDGYAFQHPCTYNADGTVTYTLQEQLAAKEGQVWSKVTWRDSSGNILGAKAVIWAVDMAGIEDDAIVSSSDLPLIEQAAEFASEYEEKVADMIAEMQIVPGQVVIDGTLTVPGAAADAKAVGARFKQDELQLWTPDIKTALLTCFQNVAWINDQGQTYYDALETALYANDYPRLTAVYTAGASPVYTDDELSSVKNDLTVTYYTDPDDTGTIIPGADYSLSGVLTAGISTLTVTYSTLRAYVSVPTVDYYNQYTWEFPADNASNAVEKINGTVITPSADNQNRIGINAGAPYGDSMRTFAVRKGRTLAFYGVASNTYYPIPIPVDANYVRVTILDASIYVRSVVVRYNSDSSTYTLISGASWAQGESTKAFTAGENLYLIPICKATSDGTTPFSVEPSKLVVEFSTQ